MLFRSIQILPSHPPTRTYDLASSTQLAWRIADGSELNLMRASSRELKDYSVEYFTKANSRLQLQKVTVELIPMPLAKGRLQKRYALQTCITPGTNGQPGLGFTGEQIMEARSRHPLSTYQRLLEFLGLPPSTGNSCVVVTLKAAPNQSIPDRVLFQKIIKSIMPLFASGDHKASPTNHSAS